VNNTFGMRSAKLIAIDGGHWLAVLLLMARSSAPGASKVRPKWGIARLVAPATAVA
jgi:hypothetical protein